MRRAFILALGVAFVCLSLVADKGPMFVGLSLRPDRPRSVTGTVTRWRPGEAIAVANVDSGLHGFEMSLRRNTVYEGEPHTIRSGTRVIVWYRNLGERRLVVEKVRVLDAVAR
jgi:hypothetical protein